MPSRFKIKYSGWGILLILAGLFFQQWRAGKISLPPQPSLSRQPFTWQVCFTPGEDCTEQITTALSQAKTKVQVQAYSFTSAPIAQALVKAHQRGLSVEVILDKSNKTDRYSAADFLSRAGISVFIDARHAISHNKIMVIDEKTVVTGSFNFTKAAQEKNAENLLILQDLSLAKLYLDNWQTHATHSSAYTLGTQSGQGQIFLK